jgi:hypothetical protein
MLSLRQYLIEATKNEFFGLSENEFYELLSDWYAGQMPKARDRFLDIRWPKELSSVPSDEIYRGISLKETFVKKLLKGESIKLKSSYLTSSWSIKLSVAKSANSRNANLIQVCIKKPVRQKNVVLYTPNLIKIPSINKLIREADSTLRDTLSNGGWEKEVIIKNDNYYLTIDLKDVMFIDGETVKTYQST